MLPAPQIIVGDFLAGLLNDVHVAKYSPAKAGPVEVDRLYAAVIVGLARADLIEEKNQLVNVLRGLIMVVEHLSSQGDALAAHKFVLLKCARKNNLFLGYFFSKRCI